MSSSISSKNIYILQISIATQHKIPNIKNAPHFMTAHQGFSEECEWNKKTLARVLCVYVCVCGKDQRATRALNIAANWVRRQILPFNIIAHSWNFRLTIYSKCLLRVCLCYDQHKNHTIWSKARLILRKKSAQHHCIDWIRMSVYIFFHSLFRQHSPLLTCTKYFCEFSAFNDL